MDGQLDEPDLRSYLGVIGRRKWWVVAVTALFLGAAVAMSVLPEPQYQVKARIVTSTGTDLAAVALGGNPPFDPDRAAEQQLERVGSTAVRFAAYNASPATLPRDEIWNIEVASAGSDENTVSNVVQISLVSTDPESAVQLLRIYAQTYVTDWQQSQTSEMIDTTTLLSQRIAEVRTQIDNATASLDQLTGVERDDVLATLESLRSERTQLERQLHSMEFGTALPRTAAEVTSPPVLPRTPITPDIPKNIAIGLLFGVMLGIAAAFLREYFDDSVKTKEIVEKATGVPVLGLIPKFDTGPSELVAAAAPSGAAAEAFRSLRTSTKFLSVDREVRVVQVTSPSPGEGKTVIAANLAVAFAQAGDRVVLVSADLRRPRVEEILGTPLTPGLTGVLIGEVALPQAIRSIDGVANLSVLPAGYPPPNPSELLSGERARRLVDVLSQTYDLVVLDCPPVLPVTDALVLARMADTTLLVTSANKTSRRALDRSVEVLQQLGAPLMGTVMTSLSAGATFSGEGYRYDTMSSGRYKAAAPSAPAGTNGYGAAQHAPAADGPVSVALPAASPAPPTSPGSAAPRPPQSAGDVNEFDGWKPDGSQN